MHPVYSVGFRMKTVVTHFIPDPQSGKGKACKTYRKPDDADDVLGLVFPQVAKGEFQVVEKHIF